MSYQQLPALLAQRGSLFSGYPLECPPAEKAGAERLWLLGIAGVGSD
jgi:hypothetical protein